METNGQLTFALRPRLFRGGPHRLLRESLPDGILPVPLDLEAVGRGRSGLRGGRVSRHGGESTPTVRLGLGGLGAHAQTKLDQTSWFWNKTPVTPDLKQLDEDIAKLRVELERLETFRAFLLDPDMARYVASTPKSGSMLTVENGHIQAVKGQRKAGKRTLFELIEEFFLNRENEWATAAEIVAGVGRARGAVSHTMYHSHVNHFEKQKGTILKDDCPVDAVLWRLKGK
jgi:hypothetical protein